MKRRRNRNECYGVSIESGRCNNSSIATDDCYNELLHGSTTIGEDADEVGFVTSDVHNSWFKRRRRTVRRGEDKTDFNSTTDKNGATAAVAASSTTTTGGFRTLYQQLVQIKRRMLPAAKKCSDLACAFRNNCVNNCNSISNKITMTTSKEEFVKARAATNPLEFLDNRRYGLSCMFVNRSALKLANIDAILDFQLATSNQRSSRHRYFLFADFCGAPGGFSEYLMKRYLSRNNSFNSNSKERTCKGYGMSLCGRNEHGNGVQWCIENQNSKSVQYRVLLGADGTGDIYKWENVLAFQREVQLDSCNLRITGPIRNNKQCSSFIASNCKMNLVVADGGFDAQRDCECQEQISQKIVLCQLAASLQLVDLGGTVVIKLFGFQTESICTALRYMYDHFGSVEIIKPISSRPFSSERYCVLQDFRGLPSNWASGPEWVASILIRSCLRKNLLYYKVFDCFLDQIDRDVTQLNLKACFALFSHLKRKIAGGGLDPLTTKHYNLRETVNSYKTAWFLFF